MNYSVFNSKQISLFVNSFRAGIVQILMNKPLQKILFAWEISNNHDTWKSAAR